MQKLILQLKKLAKEKQKNVYKNNDREETFLNQMIFQLLKILLKEGKRQEKVKQKTMFF